MSKVRLLNNPDVIRWIRGNLGFLRHPDGREYSQLTTNVEKKQAEDAWGLGIMRHLLPPNADRKQWTNVFGETIVQEVYKAQGLDVECQVRREQYRLDLVTLDHVTEVKTGTYHTDGTAHEKILGAPYKYRRIPELFGRPLRIVCCGRAELYARKEELLDPANNCPIINAWKQMHIEIVGLRDLLDSINLP